MRRLTDRRRRIPDRSPPDLDTRALRRAADSYEGRIDQYGRSTACMIAFLLLDQTHERTSVKRKSVQGSV